MFVFLPGSIAEDTEALSRLEAIAAEAAPNGRVVLVLSGAAANAYLSALPCEVVIDSARSMLEAFGVPWYACSYVVVADPLGIVRLAGAQVPLQTAISVLARYQQ